MKKVLLAASAAGMLSVLPTTVFAAATSQSQPHQQTATVAVASTYANEIALIKGKGYTVNSAAPNASVRTNSGDTLTAWIGVAMQGDGHNQFVFFFLNGKYLGTDTAKPSLEITSAKPAGTGSIAVTYPVYMKNDSFANPTGVPDTITYHWDGSKLIPNKPYPEQFAASIQYAPTTISASGVYLAHPEHIVANDPWSNHPTSWVPLFYLQEALLQYGIHTTWNGNTLNVSSVPTAWHLPSHALYSGNPASGDMQFSIAGNQHGYVRAPKLVTKDPASHQNTTYVPVYYAGLFLHKYLSMASTWSGSNWVLGPQATGPIKQTTYSSWAQANKVIGSIVRANSGDAFSGGNPTVDLGYGIKARVDGAMGRAGFQWNEGNWNVEVLFYTKNQNAKQLAENVVAYLHDHMLPAPYNQGTIIIKSTNPNSTTISPETTVAWQEGNTVYQYYTIQAPTTGLQPVVDSNHA